MKLFLAKIDLSICPNTYELLGPHLFAETSFHRIVVLPKPHVLECHFIESVFSRTSFSRHIIQPKIIFLNRHLAECLFPTHHVAENHFPESSFRRMSFFQIVVQPNTILPKMHLAKRTALLNRNVHIANFKLYEFSPYPCPNLNSITNYAYFRQPLVDKHIEQKYTRVVYLVFGEMKFCFIQFR